ncbi:MAG: BlaI/MecI/CopY family transcriptional regulator [Phycisphaerales bacterium]|nr:BlaI/MecI/CopY family transcriptional regulator [Phycisphaerales bacterium]MCI0630586.1 BlaI/MecI/CopY family transcriptional regulator [Phycisphaerales bacterium]MCI0675295.1 BlaI/MecI/CopY family transcriptional regulator [Phycisphaerales bacterium]
MPRKPRTALTKLESQIMNVVWDAQPRAIRVREVLEALNRTRSEPLAYNTVQTMLTILRDKGVVQIAPGTPGSGRGHSYRAKVSRAQASRHMVRDLADRLFGGRVQPLLHQLIEQGGLSAAELETLRAWVEAKLRDAKEEDEQ